MLSKWPKPSLEVLTNIIKQYESFHTADAKESSNKNEAKLLKGKTQPVPKALFKQISKGHPEYFLKFCEKVIKSQVYFGDKQAIERFQKGRDETT